MGGDLFPRPRTPLSGRIRVRRWAGRMAKAKRLLSAVETVVVEPGDLVSVSISSQSQYPSP